MRYYVVDASASLIEMIIDNSKIQYKDVCVPDFNDCIITLNVCGYSIVPILKSGEIVILRVE